MKPKIWKSNYFWSPILFLLMIYLLIWFLFVYVEIFPVGQDLFKNNWLDFIGSYLSFSGTVVLGYVAYRQTIKDNQRLLKQREDEILPVFVVKLNGTNTPLGSAALMNMIVENHNNFSIEIINAGRYIVRNFKVQSSYQSFAIIPNESVTIYGVFTKSDYYLKYQNKLILFDDDVNQVADNGYPKSFFVIFDDVDGNEYSQYFDLDSSGEYYKYSKAERM